MGDIRQDFPILQSHVNGQPLIYLDNAATMQMPLPVQNRMRHFYEKENANIHRGMYSLSEDATFSYEEVRNIVRRYLSGGSGDEVIFTSGTTDAVNLVAGMAEPLLKQGDEILITDMEHHSNYLPWRQLCARRNLKLRIVRTDDQGQVDLDHLDRLLNEKVKLAAFTQLSNVTGIEPPVQDIIARIRKQTPAWILVDGAQGVVHCREPIPALDCDFYCFSGHKLGAPAGTGVLYVKGSVFSLLRPVRFGGGTVNRVSEEEILFVDGPAVFEPGTPNYAGVIGLGEALHYWEERKEEFIREDFLLRALEQGLLEMDGVHILGKSAHRKGCLSVTIDGVHPYDFCRFLDLKGIAVRSGHLCAAPYLQALGTEHAIRFSVAPYNTLEEIEAVLEACREVVQRLRKWQRS